MLYNEANAKRDTKIWTLLPLNPATTGVTFLLPFEEDMIVHSMLRKKIKIKNKENGVMRRGK